MNKISPLDFVKGYTYARKREFTFTQFVQYMGMSKDNAKARKRYYENTLGLIFPQLKKERSGPKSINKQELQRLLNE